LTRRFIGVEPGCAGQRELQPPQALAVGDDADLLVLGLEDRALLDVVLEIGVHLARADLLVALPADALQFIAEARAVEVLAAIGVVERKHAGEHAGRQHRRGEARALFVGPVGDDDRMLCLDAEIVERAHDFQAGQHAEHAVILAAGRLRVEMGADIDRQRVRIRAGSRHEHGTHLVHAHGEPGLVTPGLEQFAAFPVGIGKRLAVVAAGNAGADLRHLHKRIPQTVWIDSQILAGCGHSVSSHSWFLAGRGSRRRPPGKAAISRSGAALHARGRSVR